MKRLILIFVLLIIVQAIASPDLNSDGIVNFADYAVFANNWNTSNSGCDFNNDGIVNYKDLAIFADVWLSNNIVIQSLTTSASSGGTVLAPGIGIYSYVHDAYATITAAADLHYNFVNWTGSAVTAGKVAAPDSISTTCLMDADYTVQANFLIYDANTPPVSADCNYIGYTFITKEITLAATAGTQPILDYYIISGTNDVNAYLQDPASGVGKIIKFPHRLRNHNSKVWLAADHNEIFNFKWKATDGTRDSNDANCTVNVLANPKDCLSFDGQGWVTIPDDDSLDLEPNRGIAFCMKTRTPFMGILKKHETGKAGYEINLVSGKIVCNLYSATAGLVATIKSTERYDNGKWCNVVFVLNDANDSLGLYIGSGDLISGTTWYYDNYILWNFNGGVPIEQGSYSNDCNLYIGKNNDGFYKWEIDAIRSYDLVMSDVFRTLSSIQSRETAGDTETYAPVPIVRFKCNEGTGTTITDDKHSPNLVGTISDSNHVKWTPWNWFWMDINVLRDK